MRLFFSFFILSLLLQSLFSCASYTPQNLFTGNSWYLGKDDRLYQDFSKKEKLRAIINVKDEGLITVKCDAEDKYCYEYDDKTNRLVVYQDTEGLNRVVFFWVEKIGVSYSLDEEVGEVRLILFEKLNLPEMYYEE